jgi:DNA-directed RNA polymerase specialized sigma24 family protein
MKSVPIGWAAYADYQGQLAGLTSSNDRMWGLEGALDKVHDRTCPPMLFTRELLQREYATAARRERDHRARFVVELDENSDVIDPFDLLDQIVARDLLLAISAAISDPDDLTLLAGVAEGHDYAELSDELGVPAVVLRSRMMRMRRRFAG